MRAETVDRTTPRGGIRRSGGVAPDGTGWVAAGREAWHRYPSLRYLQVIPVALILWGLDAVDKFRGGAEAAGLRNAVTVASVSRQTGGGFMVSMNDWLAMHPVLGFGASVYYIVLHGLVVGVVGLLLIWRRVPSFGLHRNALIATSSIALVVFVLYPVAPPRMLPGYHDVAASASPLFDKLLDGRAADQFASLPSLHVAWALWVAVAASALLRRPLLRALAWIYPVLTVLDVLATGNHYLLDVITAPGVVLLAYLVAAALALSRRRLAGLLAARRHQGGPPDPRQLRPGAGPAAHRSADGGRPWPDLAAARAGFPLARRRASDAQLPAVAA